MLKPAPILVVLVAAAGCGGTGNLRASAARWWHLPPRHRSLGAAAAAGRRRDGSEAPPRVPPASAAGSLGWIAATRGGHAEQGAAAAAPAAAAAATSAAAPSAEAGTDEEDELGDKVRRAMIKLGLAPPVAPGDDEAAGNSNEACEGGVCEVVPPEPPSASIVDPSMSSVSYDAEEDADVIAARLAAELDVDESLCLAAIGATAAVSPDGSRRKFNEASARDLLRQELDRIAAVGEGSDDVRRLVSEGHDPFLSRRALAFAEGNMEDARAILEADRMDGRAEDEMRQKQLQQQKEASRASPPSPDLPMKTVTLDSNFDPTAATPPSASKPSSSAPQGMPAPARKGDVVFEATAAQIQELVLESPVPVLLDVYADWCGPCKVLGPALEEMAVKSGGAFRLVKVNADNERAVTSSALGVTALPTVFGIRNGKILNMFQGMPRSESYMKSFMMGLLVSESQFDPPVTAAEKKVYGDLTSKLIKTAGSASFPFSARERLQDRVVARLDELAEQARDFVEAEESTQVLKSLLSNVIRDPSSVKFRTVNLSNKVIASKITRFPPGVAILKSVGFAPDGIAEETLILGKGKKIVNVAPLMTARECIEKWVDKSRYEVAKAARRRRDEEDRAKLQLERGDSGDESEDGGSSSARNRATSAARDPDACTIKVRFDGKNKIHELELRADDPLSAILERLAVDTSDEVQITCIAKRLTVTSLDPARMQQSLRSLGLAPSSYLVISIGDRIRSRSSVGTTINSGSEAPATSSLSERAAAKQKQKKGSHTMQSIGIYAKDDNNKAELIDGGGGVWYEHDVTDDEEEESQTQQESKVQTPEQVESPPSTQQQSGSQLEPEDDAYLEEEGDDESSSSESSDYSEEEEEQ